jgi:acyl carrier protein
MTAALEDLPKIIATALQIPASRISPDLKMGDVEEWDSVAHLGLVVEIESSYGISFTAEEIMELTSVKSLRDRLARG